jgi:D-alanyl-D-alanine carboxypeptidase/D-alanyl-D-alanine-endopeptidase (penicillin-binding protein 4)
VGLRYAETDNVIVVIPSGDPTFLHPDFKQQNVLRFLRSRPAGITIDFSNWKDRALGSGWAWSDYSAYYMAERSPLPIYGNVVRFSDRLENLQVLPRRFSAAVIRDSTADRNLYPSSVQREMAANQFYLRGSNKVNSGIETPFHTEDGVVLDLLRDTVQKNVRSGKYGFAGNDGSLKIIRSQPTDSLLKPLMHRSDNFFAEQALLMVSNEVLGYMSDGAIIDTLLKTDFKDLPHPPRWADGSGLSRYNLFSPHDFIAILGKMKAEFGMARIREIFPTGNKGTLANYYKSDSTYLYAKTGTLSGVVALSGYMTTNQGRELIFSVLVNNHQASATAVRRAVEKFVQNVRRNY